MQVLPLVIYHEIFNLQQKPNDVVIGHLCDELDSLGLTVRECINYDHAIVIIFARDGDHPVDGEVRIDRVRRVFDVSVMVDGTMVMPASGEWGLVMEYLQKATFDG